MPQPPVEPEKLKPVLHEKIERMDAEQLALLDRVLRQLEAEHAAEHLDKAFDTDPCTGQVAACVGVGAGVPGRTPSRMTNLPRH